MGTKPRWSVAAAGLTAVCMFGGPAFADDSARYAVAKAEYKAENPASRLQLEFAPAGVVATPGRSDDGRWTFDLRLTGVSIDRQLVPLGPGQRTALDNGVDYDFSGARVSYVNGPAGLVQRVSIAQPASRGSRGRLRSSPSIFRSTVDSFR